MDCSLAWSSRSHCTLTDKAICSSSHNTETKTSAGNKQASSLERVRNKECQQHPIHTPYKQIHNINLHVQKRGKMQTSEQNKPIQTLKKPTYIETFGSC
jgi:hypothetical protein